MKQKFAVVHRPDETSRQLKAELAGKLGEAGWTEDERQPDLVLRSAGTGRFCMPCTNIWISWKK